MLTIYAKIDHSDGYIDCPLQSDVNSCKAIPDSKINFCPGSFDDETDKYTIPTTCPLNSGPVKIVLE